MPAGRIGGNGVRPGLSKLALFSGLVLIAVILRVTDANPAVAQTQVIGVWHVDSEPIMDGSAPEWQSILPIFLPTTSQQVAPPMGGGATERIAIRAVHWEDRMYVMLEWSDQTADRLSNQYEKFTDAAAIQFPAEGGTEVPSICMGQADQGVNIWQWRADLEDGRPGLPEGGYVDMYPFEEDLYFTARAAGNPLSQPSPNATQNLLAGGFGTLEATGESELQGHAVYKDARWMVVFSRDFVATGDLEPDFDGAEPVDVALAVWDGSKGERNGVKSVSAFTQMRINAEDPPRRAVAATDDWPAFDPSNPMVGISVGVIGVAQIVLLLVAIIAFGPMIFMALSRGGREYDETTPDES